MTIIHDKKGEPMSNVDMQALDAYFAAERDRHIEEYDETSYAQSIGIGAPVGEPGYGPLERNWARPTLDINGIWGGFQGEGSKTVIAREAHAKITCRLAPDQFPSHIIAAIERHIHTHCPAGIIVTVQQTAGSSSAFAIAPTHPVLRVAREALRAAYNRDPLMIRLGGTLPVADYFQKDLGQDIVFLAWSMPNKHLHGPDEFFRLENFDRGMRVYADLFERLSEHSDALKEDLPYRFSRYVIAAESTSSTMWSRYPVMAEHVPATRPSNLASSGISSFHGGILPG